MTTHFTPEQPHLPPATAPLAERRVNDPRGVAYPDVERPRILLATGNAGKVREIREIFADLDIEFLTPAEAGVAIPPIVETDRSYIENAVNKAVAVARASGLPALADDSGIEVDALDGAPGPLSARFGGVHCQSDADRYRLLMARLDGVPMAGRGAHFRAVVALAVPGNRVITREGAVDGRIALEPRGTNGHGYDPVFEVDRGSGVWKTAAELTSDEKNAISHRGRALAALREPLQHLRLG